MRQAFRLLKHESLSPAIVVSVGGRLVVGTVLTLSAVGKLFSFDTFVQQISSLFPLGSALSTLVGIFILAIEIAIVVSLAIGRWVQYASLASASLVALFSLVMLNEIVAGTPPEDCGCFGSIISSPVDTTFFIRNAVLFILSLTVFIIDGKVIAPGKNT